MFFRIPTGFSVLVHGFFGSGYEAFLNCKLSQTALKSINSISKQKFAFIRMKRRIHIILTLCLCYCVALPICTCRVVSYENDDAVCSNFHKGFSKYI